MAQCILIADDSTTIQKVIKIALSKHDMEVVSAGSYIEAINEVSKTKFAILIIDANLPGVRGVGELKKLQEDANGVPVLILCGTYENIDEETFRSAGFREFLKKPFESSDVVKAVSGALGQDLPPIGGGLGLSAGKTSEEAKLAAMTMSSKFPNDFSGLVFSLDDDNNIPLAGVKMPGSPITDEKRRGQKAFDDGNFTLAPPPPPPVYTPRKMEKEPIKVEKALPTLPLDTLPREELDALVREAVEQYCARHFPEIAREVITAELRRLADEKARYLTD